MSMSRSTRTLLRVAERSSQVSRIQPTPIFRSFTTSPRRMADTAASSSSASSAPLSPKIAPLVEQISTLSLLEVSELVTALKEKLNITEVAMPAASAAPAGGAAGAGAAPAEEVEKPKEKTIFTVKLEKFDAAAKAKIIREVKAIMPNMNLVEAKKFVESVPQTLKENLPKDEAEKLQKTLTDLGATISLS